MSKRAPLIFFDPTVEAGTSTPAPGGEMVLQVGPERFYPVYLGHVMNATIVFLHAGMTAREAGLGPEEQLRVDEAIAKAYWGDYQGYLTPAQVLKTLARASAGASGQVLLDMLDSAREEMFAATMAEAEELHAATRLQMLAQGAESLLTDYQVAVGEALADYLLMQRGVAEDIRTAERERAQGEPRWAVLEKMDRAAKMEFERMLQHVFNPAPVIDLIPKNRFRAIEAYARRRRRFPDGSLFQEDGE